MRSSEIRLRKLKLRLRDKNFANHKVPYSVICSFSNLSVTSPTSQLLNLSVTSPTSQLLQPFLRFIYATAHSPTLPLLHLRHSSFSKPSFASPTSQALHLIHLTSSPCYVQSKPNQIPLTVLSSLELCIHVLHSESLRLEI